MTNQTDIGQLLFEQQMQITSQTDFGIPLEVVMSGQVTMPPLGLRADVAYEGKVTGPGLQGTITGIDYIHLQGDGTARLHAHAVITTADGTRISLLAEGIGIPQAGSLIVKLREMQTLITATPAYEWLNSQRLWAVGESDLQTGKITLRAYAVMEERSASA